MFMDVSGNKEVYKPRSAFHSCLVFRRQQRPCYARGDLVPSAHTFASRAVAIPA